jgi:putative ABC transport system permease protein
MKFLGLLWGNLMRRKLRTVLTLLSIFVAFFLFGLLGTIKEAFAAGVTMSDADRLVVRHRVSLFMLLPINYATRMRQIDGVEAIASWTWFGGVYKDDMKNFFPNMPVDPDALFDVHPEYVFTDVDKEAWRTTRTGAAVGETLADRFGWKVGDRVPLKSPIWPKADDSAWEFDIVAIYKGKKPTTDTSSFFFRYDYFDETRTNEKGKVGWYMVRVSDPERAGDVAAAIDAEFANSSAETKAEPEAAFQQGFLEQIGSIGTILMSILSAVFFTIILVAGNTMAQAVRERTQEIGVLKAIGFTDARVLALVIAESCTVAILGGAAGLLAAWVIGQFGSPVPDLLPVFYLPPSYLAVGAGLILALGLAAGILPAIAAMRLHVAVALRRHGA